VEFLNLNSLIIGIDGRWCRVYRGSDTFLARPERKQATFPAFLWNLEFRYLIHKSPPPIPTLTKSIHFSAHHTSDRHSFFPSWSG